MLSKVFTTSVLGMEGHIITVETDTSSGIVSFYMVGLAELAVREAKERVGAAIKITVFISPPANHH